MTKSILFALFVAFPALGASASELRMTVEQPHFTCEGRASHFSHVAYHPGTAGEDLANATSDDAAPLPCCDGKIGCAQFLSTSTIVRQATQWHG